jgi:hypothetical protein
MYGKRHLAKGSMDRKALLPPFYRDKEIEYIIVTFIVAGK